MSVRKIAGAAAGMTTVAALSVTGLLAAPADAATAHSKAAACTATIQFPNKKIVVKSSTTIVPIKLAGCTNNLDTAESEIFGPHKNFLDDTAWPPRTYNMHISDKDPADVRPGTVYSKNSTGIEADGETDINFNDGSVPMKFGTKSSIAGKRAGTKTVKLNFKFTKYAARKGFVPYAKRSVALYKATSKAGPWTRVKFVTLNSKGRGAATVKTSRHNYYRVSTGSTASYWGTTSGAIKR